MTVPRFASRPRATSRSPVESSRVEALVRQLVAVADPVGAPADGGEEMVADVEVDGRRYVLIRRPPAAPAGDYSLSPREIEIARLVAKGYVNKTIAGILDISCYTVDTYLRRVFAKLNVASRAAMVAQLFNGGLLSECLRGER